MKKRLNPLTAVALIAGLLLSIVFMGCNAMGRRGANGEDLSKPAVPPANMPQGYPSAK